MWSPTAHFNPATQQEGFTLHHLDGNPPSSFKATWSRSASLDDIIDALDKLLGDLCDYDLLIHHPR